MNSRYCPVYTIRNQSEILVGKPGFGQCLIDVVSDEKVAVYFTGCQKQFRMGSGVFS
jgi:hypothetical protein